MAGSLPKPDSASVGVKTLEMARARIMRIATISLRSFSVKSSPKAAIRITKKAICCMFRLASKIGLRG
jgi:hypothetical protein